jgi:hypothetical protein
MTIFTTPPVTLTNGTTADATKVMQDINQIVSDGNANAIDKSGVTPFTGNQSMGGNKLTSVGAATLITDAPNAGQIQSSALTKLSSVSGTDTITASATPTLAGYSTGQTLQFISAGANTTTTVTLNVNGLGAKNILRAGSGALAVGDIANGQVVEVYYNGTFFEFTNTQHAATSDLATAATTQAVGDNSTKVATTAFVQLSSAAIRGASRNLVITTTGGNANVLVAFDEMCLENASNLGVVVRNQSLTINTAGAVGSPLSLSTGVLAGSTFYAVIIWNNGTTTTATIDPSATSPTAPTGYTSGFYAFAGWIQTDGTANKYPLGMQKKGGVTRLIVGSGNVAGLTVLLSGVQGAPTVPTWQVKSLSGIVPSTATSILVVLTCGTNSTAICAPNNSYGAYASTTNPPPLTLSNSAPSRAHAPFEMWLESTNIYYAADNAADGLYLAGWRDAE